MADAVRTELFTDDTERQAQIAQACAEFAASHGLLVAPRGQDDAHCRARRFAVAPCTVLPSPFPRSAFETAVSVQRLVNVLMDRVARHEDFLVKHLKSTCEVDDFTRNIMSLYTEARAQHPHKYATGIHFGLLRNDFLLNAATPSTPFSEANPWQVEINAIASSFGMLSARVSKMHREILPKFFVDKQSDWFDKHLPRNDTEAGFVSAFKACWDAYMNDFSGALEVSKRTPKPVMLMVVQPNEFNSFDQKHLENALQDQAGIETVRLTLGEIHRYGQHVDLPKAKAGTPPALVLTLPTGRQVHAVIAYFRAGYAPTDYPTQDEWRARSLIELSNAVACPNAAYHLAGTKKIQQVLSSPTILSELIKSDEVELLHKTFTSLYSLDVEELKQVGMTLDQVMSPAISAPQDFVLKPQREGGANNLYNDELKRALQTMSREELRGYILMQRIRPPPVLALVMTEKRCPSAVAATNELGIFGGFVSKSDNDILFNQPLGHLVRTKSVDVDETGVAAGFGAIDSPFLVD